MQQNYTLLIAKMLLIIFGFTGCGTTGKTSYFVLDLNIPAIQTFNSNIQLASVAMEEGAPIFNVVNVMPWGMFETHDLKNIEQSFRDTIAQYLPEKTNTIDRRFDIHLIVRRYFVSLSNTAGAVLVCVDWAVTSAEGKILYDEQFFAADDGYLIGTIGLLKDSVHKAIVRRIATISLALAINPEAKTGWQAFDNTYPTLSEAVSHLPATMVSLGDPVLAAFPLSTISVVGILAPSGVSHVSWSKAEPSQNFDWQGYLGEIYQKK